ncbi:MAG: glycosyltransferase family 4 protein [Thermoleophilia bacterium]
MRVGLVSPYSWDVPSGVNDHIASLARELQVHGHDPWIIAPIGRPVGSRRRSAAFDRLLSAGSAVPFPSNGSKAYVNVWPLMPRRMARLLAEGGFDLLHVHEPCTPSVAGSAVLVGDMPIVGTFHAAGENSPLYKAFAPAARRVIDRLAVKIAVSEAARDFVADRFPGDYRVIPNGVRVADYASARGMAKTPGRILFVGRAEPRKGLSVLLQAFPRVRMYHRDATLVMVGPDWADVHAALARVDGCSVRRTSGLAALGRLDHETKVREMGEAQVLCVPSLSGESFGLVLVEGLAAGVPVLASDLPGYRRVLHDGALGRLVPPGDPDALARELVHLLDDPRGRAAAATRGIRAVERYAWSTVVERIMLAYEEALAVGRVRRPRGVHAGPACRLPLLARGRSR